MPQVMVAMLIIWTVVKERPKTIIPSMSDQSKFVFLITRNNENGKPRANDLFAAATLA